MFITHNYPRWDGDTAGIFLEPLATALVRRGHQVEVVVPSYAGEGGSVERHGVLIERVRYSWTVNERWSGTGTMQEGIRSPAGWLGLAGMGIALRRTIRRRWRPGTVLHAHWWVPGGVVCPRGVPTVLTLHGTDGRLLEGSALVSRIGCRVVRRMTAVTTVSRALADVVQRQCGRVIPADHVLAMPIDPSTIPRSRGGGGGVVISRLTIQKRVDLILEAMALLAEAGDTVSVTIIGGGSEAVRLQQRVTALGIASMVTFAGEQSPEGARRALEKADWSMAVGRQEGFGLAAVEALVAGVPVVACRDGGGILDIVPPMGAGRHVEPTAAGIAEGLRDLLKDGTAREEAERLGLEWRKRLTPDAVAQRFEEIYAGALRG